MTTYVISDDLGNVVDRTGSQVEAYELKQRLDKQDDDRYYGVTKKSHFVPDENSAEDNDADDDTSTMSVTYDFVADDSSTDNDNDFSQIGSMWNLGDHSGLSDQNTVSLQNAIEGVLDEADEDVDGDVVDVLEDAADLVEDTSVTSFECPHPDCGLHHGHADHKHDIREGFNVRESFAAEMEFTPYCHCGVNELAMLMEFYGIIEIDVFEDGDRFEAASKLPAGDLNVAYRAYEEGVGLSRAVDEHITTPLSLEERDEVEAFFSRRSAIDNAADGAPIPQQTRSVITENRDALIEATE